MRTSLALLAAAAATTIALAGPAAAQDACAKTTEGTAMLADYPAVRAFYDAISTADPALIDCAVAAEWTSTPSAPGTPPGPEGIKPALAGIAASFGTYTFKTEDVIVSGDKVVVRSTATAHQTGPFLGIAPGGDPVQFQTIDIHRLGADGKMVESWHVEDWLSFLFQRGALPLQN